MEVKESDIACAEQTSTSAAEGPPEWERRALGTLGSWLSGSTPSMSNTEYWRGGVIPWVSPKDMKVPRLYDATDRVSQRAIADGAKLLPEGSVLIVIRGMILAHSLPVALAMRRLSFNQDIKAVVPHAGVCGEFLLYWLDANKEQIRRLITESTHGTKRLPPEMLYREVVGLPDSREQQAIADALSDADALIESLSRLLAKKRKVKQGAMQELLTGRRRLPGFTGAWETKSLAALAKIQRGASPRPIDDPKWFDNSSQVGWVRISDVTQAGMYLEFTVQRLSAAGIRHSRPVAAGSLIMSICATVGKPIITAIETCIHDGFVVFEDLQVDQKFLYYALLAIEQDWGRHGQSGSQMNLNTGLINRTEIAVAPTKEEQRVISQALADMDADIAAVESRLNKARDLKQGMMQELLTGRRRLVQPVSNAKPSHVRFADDNIAGTVAKCRTLLNG